MRGLWFVVTLGPSAFSGDAWLASDKIQHFVSSAFVQGMGYGTLRAAGIPHGAALAGASVATVAVGAGKEIYDAGHHGDPSVKDFAWDLAGAGAMTVLLVPTRR